MAAGDLHEEKDGRIWLELECPNCHHILSVEAEMILGIAKELEVSGDN